MRAKIWWLERIPYLAMFLVWLVNQNHAGDREYRTLMGLLAAVLVFSLTTKFVVKRINRGRDSFLALQIVGLSAQLLVCIVVAAAVVANGIEPTPWLWWALGLSGLTLCCWFAMDTIEQRNPTYRAAG